jgi:hypothetical protein
MGTEQQDGSMVQVTERREKFTVGNHSEEDPSLGAASDHVPYISLNPVVVLDSKLG